MNHLDTPPIRLPRSFTCLNIAQFLGALNDNLFKMFMIFALVTAGDARGAGVVTGLAGIVFVLPFLFFTPLAGALADRLAKSRIVRFSKWFELAVMILGLLAFAAGQSWMLFAVLFLMATQSSLFSPAKMGIIPELVGKERLSKANSLLTMFTFVAIVLGSAFAPLAGEVTGGNYRLTQWVCVILAAIGVAVAYGVAPTRAVGSPRQATWLPLRDVWRTMRWVRQDTYLFLAVLASAYFMFLGAYLQMNIIPFGMERLGLTQERSGYLFFLAATGIALGSYAAGRLSGRDIEFGIAPLGSLLLTLSVFMILFSGTITGVAIIMLMAGVGAGLFVVPLDAFIQYRAPSDKLGETLGAANFLSWVGVALAAVLVSVFHALHIPAAFGFLLMGVMTLALTLATFRVLPDFLLRFVVLVITRLAFRLRLIGRGNIPVDGPALLVCNHTSYVDALLLIATQQRRLRFVMSRQIYETWTWARPFFDLLGCIPIEANDPPRRLVESLRAARQALDEGYQVCIFAEGALTRTGTLQPFRRGFERIVKDTDYPIIPVYIGGAWGSIASYYHGHFVRRWPALLRYPVSVLYGRPLPAASSVQEIKTAVMDLSCAYFNDRRPQRRPLIEAFIRNARRRWRTFALADTTGKRLTYGRVLTASVALARRVRTRLESDERVGILLPPSAGGVLANLAVALTGKVGVNLNYTASPEGFRSACEQCALRHVITSRLFCERFPNLPLPEQVIYIEDELKALKKTDLLAALLAARLWPARLLRTAARPFDPDETATILFSSGSTAAPKGIMLSHHNILSNIEALRIVFTQSPRDHLCAVLPFFHSLGYTATLWYPLLSGLPVTYHTNPLEGDVVARIVREEHSTLLFATPTFLLLYLRKAAPADFATLRHVVTGAEKLSPRLAASFEERFGVRPLEGYGATELSPVVSLSLPHVEAGGVAQAGWKEGSVGVPLPGLAVRIVDPETGEPRPVGQPGLLLVRGPNLMTGYLNRPDLTAEAIVDGWYRTGDIAMLDENGFISITDRLSRFSKIGGEMIPHQAVEEDLRRLLDCGSDALVLAAVPDERKGERLIVLHTPALTKEAIADALRRSELPNLWKPARQDLAPIPAIPVLGSGKLDLAALKTLARTSCPPR